MLRDMKKLLGQKGSMMVEALAMLGLISMVTPVLYKKSAERTSELQDINTATQMRTLSKALDDYIQNNYVELSQQSSPSVTVTDIEDYLPYGFNTGDSKMFSGYSFAIKKSGDANYPTLTGIVTANLRDANTPAIRTAKVASMIGANGGVVRGSEVQGVQGGWSASTGDLDATVNDGDIVAISSNAVTASSGVSSEEVLYRTSSRGKAYNTMSTSIYMADNPIQEINKLIVSAGSASGEGLVIGTGTDAANAANLTVKGAASVVQKITGTGGIGVTGGAVTLQGNAASELSTSAGNLTVKSTAGKLDMAGQTADLKATTGALAMAGKTTASLAAEGGKLTLTGSSDADLKASSGTLTMSGGTSAKTSSGAATLTLTNSGGTAALAGTATTVSGTTSAVAQSGSAKLTLTNTNAVSTLEGTTTTVKGTTTAKVQGGTGTITVTNSNIAISGNTTVSNGSFIAKGTGSIDGNFYANSSNLQSTSAGFAANGIAGSPAAANAKTKTSGGLLTDNIYITNNAFIGGKLSVDNLDVVNTFRAGVSGTSVTFYADQDNVLAKTNDFAVKTTGNSDRIIADNNNVRIGENSGTNIAYIQASISNKSITAESDNFALREDRLIISPKASESFKDTTVGSNTSLAEDSVSSSGVALYRKGIIQLPRNASSSAPTGYIKADRLVGNDDSGLATLDPYAAHGSAATNSTASNAEKYDKYQVNPAYTSVMHDIKLTTRGGARLSDILPDFINKGIYVLDNTYKEDGNGWDDIKVSDAGVLSDLPGDCPDANCMTTPWMGFIPAPQCPPGYAKVVTIHPIRWKMADVLSITPDGTSSTPNQMITANLKTNYNYENFNQTFLTITNPDLAIYKTDSVTAAADTAHEHIIQGSPLNYQINTWLNTTVSGTIGSEGNLSPFLGWHALMGFLYSGSMYQEYITAIKSETAATSLKNMIVWNLFPVYYQELSAVADTYCYFERDNTYVKWDENGGTNLIDTEYDQISNYRKGYDNKPSGYVNRLNDPNLEYRDPW